MILAAGKSFLNYHITWFTNFVKGSLEGEGVILSEQKSLQWEHGSFICEYRLVTDGKDKLHSVSKETQHAVVTEKLTA